MVLQFSYGSLKYMYLTGVIKSSTVLLRDLFLCYPKEGTIVSTNTIDISHADLFFSFCENSFFIILFNPLALELDIYRLAHHLCKTVNIL
jgi:hypothetical protein